MQGAYPAFAIKFSLLFLNMVGLTLGLLGVLMSYCKWRQVFPLLLVLVYFTSVYTFLHAIPRYRLPMMPYVLIFTATAWNRIVLYLRA